MSAPDRLAYCSTLPFRALECLFALHPTQSPKSAYLWTEGSSVIDSKVPKNLIDLVFAGMGRPRVGGEWHPLSLLVLAECLC